MSRAVRFTRAARHDIRQAFKWYEAQSAGVGAKFLQAVDEATKRLAESAMTFRVERSKYRRIPLRRFPYALHFRTEAEATVTVLACIHFRQSPDRWPGA